MGATPAETPSDLAARLDPPERLFTVDEADRLLPSLEAAFREMDAIALRLQEVSDLVQDMEAYWSGRLADPDLPDRPRYLELVRERDAAQPALDREIQAVHARGVLLKDFQSGLVDFYGIVAGKLVFLCWRRGEPSVRFYHSLEGGYAGRKPLAPVA